MAHFLKSLTAEKLREKLTYSAETGEFKWRCNDRLAGSLNGKGYIQIKIEGVIYLAHRLAFLYVTNSWPTKLVDHKDGVRSNNVFANLRHISPSHNSQNQRAAHKDSHTGFLGVERSGKGFQARITIPGGKRIGVGSYPTAEQAHQAYVTAKRVIHEGGTL